MPYGGCVRRPLCRFGPTLNPVEPQWRADMVPSTFGLRMSRVSMVPEVYGPIPRFRVSLSKSRWVSRVYPIWDHFRWERSGVHSWSTPVSVQHPWRVGDVRVCSWDADDSGGSSSRLWDRNRVTSAVTNARKRRNRRLSGRFRGHDRWSWTSCQRPTNGKRAPNCECEGPVPLQSLRFQARPSRPYGPSAAAAAVVVTTTPGDPLRRRLPPRASRWQSHGRGGSRGERRVRLSNFPGVT